MSQRGNPLLRRVDSVVGPVVIVLVGLLIRIRRLCSRPCQNGATLIVCFGAIGDLLLLSAAAQKVLTGRRLILACTPENRAAATIFPGLYDHLIVVRLSRPWSLLSAARRLDVSNVYDSTQWANVSALQVGMLKLAVPGIALHGFKTRTVARSLVYDELVPHSTEAHETANFASLLEAESFDPAALVFGTPPTTRNVALHLWPSGSRSHLKEWPLEYWTDLAQRLHGHGYVLFATGSPADLDRNDEFIATAGVPITNLAGQLNLREVFDFFRAEVRLCVSVNTGTAHLAALAGSAVISLNGPTNPDRWGPPGSNSIALVPSAGRFGYLHHGFEYPESDVEAYSLDHLGVDRVFEACMRVLA